MALFETVRGQAHAALLLVSLVCQSSCGSRSEISAWELPSTDGQPTCSELGQPCAVEADCCDAACLKDLCALPPASCLSDSSPVALVTGLADPYALASSATSLFVGQLAPGKPILRIPKEGGEPQSLVDQVDWVDYVLARDGLLYFSDQTAVHAVSTSGGTVNLLAKAARPAGIDVTHSSIFVADYLGEQLLEVDKATHQTKILNQNLSFRAFTALPQRIKSVWCTFPRPLAG